MFYFKIIIKKVGNKLPFVTAKVHLKIYRCCVLTFYLAPLKACTSQVVRFTVSFWRRQLVNSRASQLRFAISFHSKGRSVSVTLPLVAQAFHYRKWH